MTWAPWKKQLKTRYCFAEQCGFSIRCHRTHGKDGVCRGVTRRYVTCYRGGYPQMKLSEDEKESLFITLRLLSVHAHIVKRADFDVPEWHVTGFSNVHNHEMLKLNEAHLLPAYCTIFFR
ncbi:hypothetical protein H0E87_019215 [Populus deltoides]|uniref:FAR1 domain-containing protein n=1 Tax=Populus deltoides TaxID=3696 RepID=A0A8T2XRZ0_POPDE|nr:hypothetical protein H0E87_019215 [Populus deltoides]